MVDVKVDGVGLNLHGPALEVHLYVPALVAGIFGTKAWMARELARHEGQADMLSSVGLIDERFQDHRPNSPVMVFGAPRGLYRSGVHQLSQAFRVWFRLRSPALTPEGFQ